MVRCFLLVFYTGEDDNDVDGSEVLTFKGFVSVARTFYRIYLSCIDSLRRRAWPLLLPDEISWGGESTTTKATTTATTTTLSDRDRQMVRWDVDRCALSGDAKQTLVHIIEQSCHCYYQGYHFICATVFRIFGAHDVLSTIYILRRLYLSHLGQYVAPHDLPIVRLVQLMGPPMLYCIDPELYNVVDECTFAVGSILTWFAAAAATSPQSQSSSLQHQQQQQNHHHHYHDLAPRLFDAFVASHPLLPLYLSFAVLLRDKPFILDEPMYVHQPPLFHRQQHDDDDDVDGLLRQAVALMGRLPPHQRLWLITSHYYGDGVVEDLLSTAASNSLLRLVTPESSVSAVAAMFATSTGPPAWATTTATTTTTVSTCAAAAIAFPHAYMAAGLGRPKKSPPYKQVLAWLVAWLATLTGIGGGFCCWWREEKIMKRSDTTTIGTTSTTSSHTLNENKTAAKSLSNPLLADTRSAPSPPPPPLMNEERLQHG
jgi:hypothetical protein